MTLPARRLGSLTVSAIGLGCMNLSHAYDTPPPEVNAARLLNRALDLGVTMLDTAALYGAGNNERLIGRAVMHRRHEFRLASKCVLDVVDGKRVLDGRPEVILRTLDAALARLRTDHIDLYYLHRLDKAVPVEESMGALVRGVEQGKIGAIGLSEMSVATCARAHAVHPIAAVQSEYNPTVRNPEIAVLDWCAANGVGFVAFSPLARGLLPGSVVSAAYAPGDIRLAMPRFVEPRLTPNLALAARFASMAREAGLTAAQLALGWCLAKSERIVPIPGTRSLARLEENVAAVRIPLAPDLVAAVDALFPPGALQGPRYSAAMQAQIDTETFADEELA